MTTIELDPTIHDTPDNQDSNDDEDVTAHLYWRQTGQIVCGIPPEHDQHHLAHQPAQWKSGMMSCPVCGAPVCMDCLLAVS